MIVVDANVVAYFFIKGKLTPLAHRIYNKDPLWVLPDLWRDEFLNILVKTVWVGSTNTQKLLSLWEQAEQSLVQYEREVSMPLALSLALHYRISAYDAQYVALAKTLDIPLITENQRLLTYVPDMTLTMQEFLSR